MTRNKGEVGGVLFQTWNFHGDLACKLKNLNKVVLRNYEKSGLLLLFIYNLKMFTYCKQVMRKKKRSFTFSMTFIVKNLTVVPLSRYYLKYAMYRWLNKLNKGTLKVLTPDSGFSFHSLENGTIKSTTI